MGTFAGRPLCDPVHELDNCLRHGFPTDWADKANSFTCPLGMDSGRGHVLMYRQDLNILANTPATIYSNGRTTNLLNVPNDLTFSDRDAVRTFKYLHIVKTRCITPGAPNAPQAVHLVELADPRRRFRMSGGGGGAFNRRMTPGGNFAGAVLTIPTTTPTTWADAWAAIWGRLDNIKYAAVPPLPYVPDGAPDGLAYATWPAHEAARDFLHRLGLLLRWDPFADAFDLVRPGNVQPELAAAEQGALLYRLFDIEPVPVAYGSVPLNVTVVFRAQGGEEGAYGFSGIESRTYSDPNPVVGQEGGVFVFDDLPAIFTGSTLLNGADLTARANARGAEIIRAAKGFQGDAYQKVYTGFRREFLPGSEVRSVTWQDVAGGLAGGGPLTVVDRTPFHPDPFAGWRALDAGGGRDRPGPYPIPYPAPWIRHAFGTPGPGGGTPPSGYDDYSVQMWDTQAEQSRKILDVWHKSVELDDTLTPGPRETGHQTLQWAGHKISASGDSRPVYITACRNPTDVWTGLGTSLPSASNVAAAFNLDQTGVWLLHGLVVFQVTGAGGNEAVGYSLAQTAGTGKFWAGSVGGFSSIGATTGLFYGRFMTFVRVRTVPAAFSLSITRAPAGATMNAAAGSFLTALHLG